MLGDVHINATSTATSTTDIATPDEDIAVCRTLDRPCHTITFSGFGVQGELRDKVLKDVTLNFSFASKAPETNSAEDKLIVRYFAHGHWLQAGEVYLNAELSNGTNGSYFTAKLDGATEWDDLSSMNVVIEYVRSSSNSAELYLDSVWLDTRYKDRAQQVLSGTSDAEQSNLPENAEASLRDGGADPTTLYLPGGQTIDFKYTNEIGSALFMRADKQLYRAIASTTASTTAVTTVYTSVTNTGTTKENFSWYSSFLGGEGTMTNVEQYLRNVATTTQHAIRNDVTFFCDAGWQKMTGDRYSCVAGGESHVCTTLNDSKQNCLESDVTVGIDEEIAYSNEWVPFVVQAASGEIGVALPKGYTVTNQSVKTFDILPGQTLYFRFTLSSRQSGKQDFDLIARGSGHSGSLESARLRKTADLRKQKSAKKLTVLVPVKRANINEELSEKTDFGTNELPEFKFRFKTQRSFFTRVKDNLFGVTVPYSVKQAKLIHENGQIEHIPVDILYGKTGEWTLRLESLPRAHRPGKYKIELSMEEAGKTYTDTLEFYWGVLAINADKSVYQPGEVAHFSIAALNDAGDTMCNARLALTVTNPSGVSADIPVSDGGGCGINNVTSLPDFIADYAVDQVGTYGVALSRLDDAGNIVNADSDSIRASTTPEFVISRDGPTRIYPVSSYTMRIGVTPIQSFKGSVTEVVPEGFVIPDTGGAKLTRENGAILLTWDVSILEGETKDLTYVLKAPEVSPYLFLLGSVTLQDSNTKVYDEGRTWKIASDAVAIATGVAWLNGTTTTNGSEWNNATAGAIKWTTDDYDTTYFTHSTTTNSHRLTVNVAGDYLVALTLPVERTDNRPNTITMLESDIRVNGAKVDLGVARSAYNERNTAKTSSEHLTVLLHNLSVGDYIEADTRAITTVSATDNIVVGTQASLYAEYIPTSETLFTATATTTSSGTNINPAATSTMIWYDVGKRVDSGYTHSNGTSPQSITLATASDYLVYINIPDSGAVTDARPRGRVLLNGVMINGGDFKQSYIGNTGNTAASFQWSGVVRATTTNSNLSVSVIAAAAAGTLTVGSDVASIYVQKLPSSDLYFGRATTTSSGTNWNSASASNILWQADDIKDATTYTHSTGASTAHQVTVLKAGDYLLSYNDSLVGAVARGNSKTTVLVNGVAVSGAQTKSHFVSNAGGDTQSSGSLVYLLRNLAINDVISLQTIADAVAGTLVADQNALLLLWHKAAQSSFIQDTERWYVNANSATTTDPWPAGATDLNQGDAITTGNAVKSADVLQLRMALQANVNTTALADTFKLQYAAGTTCSPALTWVDVGATGSGTIWRGYDNASIAGGTTLSTTDLQLSVSSSTETYEEQNTSASAPVSVASGKDGEWAWTLQDNGAAVGTNYCFRMVQGSGTALKDYTDYSSLITNNTPGVPTLTTLFDNEKSTSTSPWFTFKTSDDNGDDINYQIQISTDPAFATTVVDTDSGSNVNDFDNIQTPSDKAPFNSGETIRYKSTATLVNGTTYYWRVRGIDPSGTNTNGSWATAYSFTIDTSLTVSTWFQTQTTQFNGGTLTNVESTTTHDVGLVAGQSSGTIWSPSISYSSHTTGNSWGNYTWTDTQTAANTIKYQIEYFTSTSSWALIPNADLIGTNVNFNNAIGTSTGPINLSGLDTSTYATIRLRAVFTRSTATAMLRDWTQAWALSVARPTMTALFDNEKTPTTTPTFIFSSSDPQGDDLDYQVQWSTDSTFTTGVSSSTSDLPLGAATFLSVLTPADTSPFSQNTSVQMKLTAASVLANNTTYWVRVRAKDPTGGNAYSLWSTARSFTVDTTVAASTWFQTTTAQFSTNSLARVTATNNAVSGLTDVGKIAIYRSAVAAEALTTTVFNHTWDTTVRQDDIYSMQYASSSILLKTGYYAVVYGARFDSTAGNNRSEIQTNFSLASTSLPIGWSQGFIRRTNGAQEAFNSGGGIIKVTNDNTALVLQSFRTDTNAAATVQRVADTSAIQLIRLDSSWHYLRLSKTGTQVGPTSLNSWTTITYDREDEVDSSYFSHTTGSGSITLKQTGHYLIFANTYGALQLSNTNTMIDQRLLLAGSDIEGSYTTVYMRGNNNSDGDYQGAASLGIIIESTTTNQALSVQIAKSLGTSAWTINANQNGTYVDRTGVTIVKIPEGDFIRMSNSSNLNLNPAAQTALTWNTSIEKDAASFSTSSVSASRIAANVAGDYLFLSGHYSKPDGLIDSEPNFTWRLTGAGSVLTYGQGGAYGATVATNLGGFISTIIPAMTTSDYIEFDTQGLGAAPGVTTVPDVRKSIQGLRIASLSEADATAQTVDSSDIVFANGAGPRWDSVTWSDTKPGSTNIKYQVYYYASTTATYVLVPNAILQVRNPQFDNGSSTTGTSSPPIDLSGISKTTYGTLRLRANFTCAAGLCPTLNDWTLTWNPGITVSGTAKQFDQTTNVTSGVVKIAVNGVLQSGKTGTISGGTWSIAGVNADSGDVITVWISSAADANEAVAVTKDGSSGNVTGMALYENHLTLGSADNPTITNADIGMYDNSVASDEDIFEDVTAGNTLNVCATGLLGCFKSKLLVLSGTVFRPSSLSGGNVNARHVQIDGTIVADGNTFTVNGSWKNNYVFTKNTSTVIFTATSTAETVDSILATSSAAFYNVTFGQTTGTTTWALSSALAASSTLSINFGTLVRGSNAILLSGDLSIGSSGIFAKGTATTTFMGSGSNTWTDSSSPPQDMGLVVDDGASKTITLASSVRATNITIGSDDTLNSGGSNSIDVIGSWVNNNVFTAQTGTVNFIATSTGKTITSGSSSFYNLTFNGANGNWSFTQGTVTAGNDFTIATGTVTMPTATTTVTGSFDSLNGAFLHNNGTILFNTTGSKTIRTATTSVFYDLAFNGSGSWTFTDMNATTSRSVAIAAGTVTFPTGTFAIAGSFGKTGGTFTANSGTMKFTASNSQSIRLNTSSAYNMTFNGTGGAWTFADTYATSTNTIRIENGTTTFPTGTLAIGGSLINAASPSGGFTHNNGIVSFTSTASGNSVTNGLSNFYDLMFNGIGGSWTITANATSTHNTTFSQATSITLTSGKSLEVDGTFTNSVANSATTWTGSTLYLNSGTTYAINAKANGGDTYAQLTMGANTQISMWNSSATSISTGASGSLYSQNNAGTSGALYIYGAYTSTGNEFWSYATDFDGTALGGSSRQANVRIASSSVITLTGSTTILGITTATTTIGSQGSGFYSFNITAGTTSAKYYSVGSTTPAGLSISGATTVISSLDNGAYELNTPAGGTSITISGPVIDKNPTMQILYTRFATSTGVLNGFNVTESGGAPSTGQYWWFRSGYGPFYGESYDNDPGPGGGNPGYVQFDDSGITVTFSGHVYSDHGTTAMAASVCNGSTPVVVIRTSGGLSYSGSCDGAGAFSFPVTFVTSNVLTGYLNTNGGRRAVTITKNVNGNVTNFDLFENAVIVRQFDSTPTTIADMSLVDSTFDSDIPFTATSSLMVQPNTELYVWTGKLFSPGGDITLQSGGSGDARDGRLYIATSSTFTLSGTPHIAVGGGLHLDTGAIYTAASSTITFTATTTGKGIFSFTPLTLSDVVMSGVGGQWLLNGTSTATTSVYSLNVVSGTLSGTGDIITRSDGITGAGIVSMNGGLFVLQGTGSLGNANSWKFYDLALGDGVAVGTMTKSGVGTTTITHLLNITANNTLLAGTSPWFLYGGGSPFVINGTFTVQTAAFTYTATSSATIKNATYATLTLAPGGSTAPTYTFAGGSLFASSLIIGTSTAVTANADTNDPSMSMTGDVTIASGSTFIASNVGAMQVAGNWTNSGTFTPSGNAVTFNATATGKTINAGASSFYDLTLDGPTGGWTITNNATSTHNTSITNASAFTISPTVTLEVDGTFTNAVGGASTTLANSYLFLNSATSYTLNTKTTGADAYGNLVVGPSTNIRTWNSTATTSIVNSTGSLYSQNNANTNGISVSGDLYIWGAYNRSSGSDYWSYGTDFDGTALTSGQSRQVNVRIASSSSFTLSGGILDVIGTSTASTTIQVQGTGAYAYNVSGGSLNASYYVFRNTDPNGLNLSGSPTITGLSNGDFLMATSSNTMITVAASVITANPLKIFRYVKFATSTGVVSGFNVTGTGSTGSYWKFNLGYGNLYGESYDSDPTGDPGQIRFDDSNDHVSITGKVYSDEGTTVSAGCNNSTQYVTLKVQGLGSYTSSCASGTGTFSFPSVGFNPGDTLTLYLASSSKRSAVVSRGPSANISNMDVYEHRVILRNEDATALSISDIDQYDSGQDTNIPFLATVGGTNTLVVEPNTKLIVWTGKTFSPGGNVTVQSGGVNAWDGTIELYTNSTWTASGSQAHSLGGSFILGSGAIYTAANSTLTFTATTTGKTITPLTSTFYNITFNGGGGNWAFSSANATSTNNFTITAGTVTLPTSVMEVGGSFANTGTFMHNNGLVKLTSVASGKNIQVSTSTFYNLTADGAGGAWSFADTVATTSNNFTITNGTVTAPGGSLNVGSSFINSGTFTNNNGTVIMYSTTGGKSVQAGGSNLYSLSFTGVSGGWTFLDTNATTSRNMTMATGTVTFPTGTMAVGGSFNSASTTFINSSGIVRFTATTTGFSVNVGTTTFYNLVFDSAAGGWILGSSATSTRDTTIANAASFTLSSGKSLEVKGTFTNSAGSATVWTGTTLYLNSGTSYSMNAKANTGATYSQLTLGASTQVRSWKSSASTTTPASSASLYSQNHANVSGSLYIFGTYSKTSGTDDWSYATDFDSTALGGSSRQVNVRVATSSTVSYSNATLNIVGTATATTTIYASGTTSYGISLAGGTFNASYYQFKNTDSSGLSLSGSPVVTSLSNGDFEVSVASGTVMTVAGSVIDANSSLTISAIKMATTSPNTRGFNVYVTGAPGNFWTFTGHYGNFAGEAYDADGTNACGHVRWDDSDCQFINEAHYRFRNDDGGEGALASTWYDNSWTRRQKISISNANATAYTDIPIKLVVPYDTDMQTNFDDLRFTDSSGTTSIPYWRESTINSASTTVWVKVPTLSSSGSATIYMYYGNGAAVGADSGSNTFSFIEDFEDNIITDFSGDTTGGYFSTSASFNHNGTYGLAGSPSSGQTPNGLYLTGSQTAQGKTIRWFQYVDTVLGAGNDEPCAFFGVQANPTAGDYAVCLDQFTAGASGPRVSIAKNTHSRDLGGTVMASTSVNYTTLGSRWLEVVVDWLTTNVINVNVYNADSSLFATVSTTTSTYTSGGIGWGHFNFNGGWDTLMVKQYTAVTPTYLFGSEQLNNGATWKVAEDTTLTGLLPLSNVRLRFSIQNTGTAVTGHIYRLQFADKGAASNCESVSTLNFNDVPTTSGGCGGNAACMTTSSQFTNLASTSPSLTYAASLAYTPGYAVQDPSNQSNAMSVGHNVATELEYNFQITNSATQPAYCFRVSNGGIDLANYDRVAEAVIGYPPVVTNFTLNNAQNINLVEAATTTIYVTATTTDNNGYTDLVSATGTIYRSGISGAAACAGNDNSCYQIATTSCAFSSCSGNQCTLTCSAPVQYIADPTDVGTYSAQNWLARIQVADASNLNTVQTTASGVELNTLYALNVTTGTIDFGDITVGQNSGTTVATSTIQNTGNAGIDVQVSGTNLTDGSNTIAVGEQKYATSTFAYGSCSICQFLTGSAANVDLNLPRTSATTTQSTTTVYWGINVPNGTAATVHAGTNTFIAVTQ